METSNNQEGTFYHIYPYLMVFSALVIASTVFLFIAFFRVPKTKDGISFVITALFFFALSLFPLIRMFSNLKKIKKERKKKAGEEKKKYRDKFISLGLSIERARLDRVSIGLWIERIEREQRWTNKRLSESIEDILSRLKEVENCTQNNNADGEKRKEVVEPSIMRTSKKRPKKLPKNPTEPHRYRLLDMDLDEDPP